MRSSWVIAFILTAALGAWLAKPYMLPAKEVEVTDEQVADKPHEKALMRVQTRLSSAQLVRRELVLNGRSQAARSVTLRAEIDGRVIDLPLDKGDVVGAGAVVAVLDERDKKAWETRAAAMLREREIEYEASRKLGKKGFQSDMKVAQALANLEEARATLIQSRLALDHATIEASFAGIVEDRPVEVGDFVQKGDPLVEVIELDPLIVTADVPETYYHRFIGQTETEIGFTGLGKRQGQVHFLSNEADPQTRTFHLEIEVPNPGLKLPAGVTSEVSIAFEPESAHAIEASLLTLNDAGQIGIKTLDALGQVMFAPAEIIKSSAETLWLAGLPDEIEVITIGQGFVKPGEKVEPVREVQDQNDKAPIVAQQ